MSSSITVWNHSPHYVAATQVLLSPGVMSNYVVPRRIGHSEFDVTGFVFGQAEWSKENLPDILYVLEAPAGWDVFRKSTPPPQKKDASGNLMFERYDRPIEYDKDGKPKPRKSREPLLDFPVLPDVIGTQEPWWYFEAVRRIDPRIHWIDITMRMPLEGRPSENSLNQDGVRNRPKYGMRSWFPKQVHQAHNARRDTVMDMLSQAQIDANTTRGTTPGLKDPALGEAGGRILHPTGRKGLGVRRGPKTKIPLKISVENLEGEGDADVAEPEDGDDEASDGENSDRCTGYAKSGAKPTRLTTQRSTFEIAKDWTWVGNTLFDGQGLGKSRPPPRGQSVVCQALASTITKRKAEEQDEQHPELPPKKRLVGQLPIHPIQSHSHSSELPRNLFTQTFDSSQFHHNATAKPKAHRPLDWHAIEHATPYDLTSYSNFFRDSNWDAQSTTGLLPCRSGHLPPPLSQNSHPAAATDHTERVQSGPNSKRKRDDTPPLEEDTGHVTKRSRQDSAVGTELRSVNVGSPPVQPSSGIPSIGRIKQSLMIVLPPTRSSKRKRNPQSSCPDSEEETVKKKKISGDSFKAALDYHYPPVLPTRIHRDGSRTWG